MRLSRVPAPALFGMLQCSRSSLDEVSPRGHAGELLEQQAALPAAAEAQLADQLLVSGFAAGGARNPRQQFPIGHSLRVGQPGRLWRPQSE